MLCFAFGPPQKHAQAPGKRGPDLAGCRPGLESLVGWRCSKPNGTVLSVVVSLVALPSTHLAYHEALLWGLYRNC